MKQNKLINDDPGYLRKIVFKRGATNDLSLKKMVNLADIAERSGNNNSQLGFETTTPTMYRVLTDKEYKNVLELDDFKHSGSVYEKVRNQIHPDCIVFVHVSNIEGEFSKTPAIAKYLESWGG